MPRTAKKTTAIKGLSGTSRKGAKSPKESTSPKQLKSPKLKQPNAAIFREKADYMAMVHGLMDQGLDHADAVDTLKVGLREANGIPVPLALQVI